MKGMGKEKGYGYGKDGGYYAYDQGKGYGDKDYGKRGAFVEQGYDYGAYGGKGKACAQYEESKGYCASQQGKEYSKGYGKDAAAGGGKEGAGGYCSSQQQ